MEGREMNRREVLFSLAGALSALLPATSAKKTRLGIVIHSFSIRDALQRSPGTDVSFRDPLNFLEYCHRLGAGGIQAPQVTDADSASTILEHARFAPDGMRGVCRFVRSADYSSMDRQEYFRTSNEALVIAQIEGEEALLNLKEILDVRGIDIVFIGPYDLSQSLGVPGQVDHPRVVAEMRKIVETCRECGIATGTFVDTMEDARRWIDAGVAYISYSVDVGLFTEVCAGTVKAISGEKK